MLRRILLFLVIAVMLAGVIAGCGQKQAVADTQDTAAQADQTTTQKAEEPKKEIKLTMFQDAAGAKSETTRQMMDEVKKVKGIQIDYNIIPGTLEEVEKKVDMALMSGDQTDLLFVNNPLREYKLVKGDLLYKINDLAKEANYDMEKIYGQYLKKWDGGAVYDLPYSLSNHVVFFNKKIFDDAKVPYPSGAWTWDQFVETAKKLTDPQKGIYGCMFEQWEYFFYTQANQKKVLPYKPDGTSNYDDQAFKESLKWFGSLGNELKICPSWLEMTVKKIPWDGFMQGKYAMIFVGYWHQSLFFDMNTYPRDWKYGITQSPTPPDAKNNLVSSEPIGICKNTKYPKEAFTALTYIAENYYKYAGKLTARQDLKPEEYKAIFQQYADKDPGSVTADELYNAVLKNGLGAVPEKVIGPATNQYQQAILKQGELYLIGKQDLDTTIGNIKKMADEAIKEEQK